MASKKPLFSDGKLRRTANGRLTLNGRFVSKRRLAQYKAARTRRGKSTRIPRKIPAPAPKKTLGATKAARTREAEAEGARFVRERKTTGMGIRQRVYELESLTIEAVTAAIARESLENDRVLVWGVVEGLTDGGDEATAGTKLKRATDADTPADIVDELEAWIGAYEIASIDTILLVFRFPL